MKNWKNNLLLTTALSAPETGTGAAAPTETSTEAPAADDSGDDFDASGDDFDVGTLAERTEAAPAAPAAPTAEPAPATAATPATPAAPETPAVPAAPTTPAAAAAAPPAAPAAPATAAPTVPPAAAAPTPAAPPALPPAGPTPAPAPVPQAAQTVEQAVAERTEWRNKTIDALALGHYKLTPELVEEIQATPEVTIPKLMARVYLDASEAASLGVMQNLPHVIMQTLNNLREAEAAEADFYKAWPALDREKHHTAIMQLATAYRQLNPSASKEDFIKFVGSQAIVALGLTTAAAPAPAAAPVPSAAPAAAPPHRPLTGVVPVTRPAAPAQVSPFAQFAEEDLAYDRGE